MFGGAMNKKWSLTKKLLSIRGELSIIAGILMIPHIIVYATKFLMKFIQGKEISAYTYIYIIFGVIAFALLIPLFITSLKEVKVKMKFKKWKSIQRWSYLFFALIYLHVVIILVNGKEFDVLKFALYSSVFFVYTALKINKYNVEFR